MDPHYAARAIDAAFNEIAAVERAASLYRPDSALARLNRERRLPGADSLLLALTASACEWGRQTGGAFDPSLQSLWLLHAAAGARNARPEAAQIARIRASTDHRAIEINGSHLCLPLPDMQLTLNGIAQGFAADRAMEALRAYGVEHALVDAGEFSAIGGMPESGRPWRIGLRDPQTTTPPAAVRSIPLIDMALASSASSGYRFGADPAHHHILDPRTGSPTTRIAGATVRAPDATTADALSTALVVMGLDTGLELVESLTGVEACLFCSDGGLVRSSGFI